MPSFGEHKPSTLNGVQMHALRNHLDRFLLTEGSTSGTREKTIQNPHHNWGRRPAQLLGYFPFTLVKGVFQPFCDGTMLIL